MHSCNSDYWRRYTLKCLCSCVQGKVGELLQPKGASEDCLEVCFVGLVVGRNYVWCLVIVVVGVVIILVMGFGGAKRWGDALKSLFGVVIQATRSDNFYEKGEFSLCSTAVLKLYCKSYWVL